MSEEEADDTPILDIKPALTKEENYPAWMRELITKEKIFTEKLESVKTEIKQVNKGLRELDEKKKTFKQVQRDYKPQKMVKQPEIQGDYHQYYSQLKYERNSKLNNQLINPLIAKHILFCSNEPIRMCLVYQRVCQRWNQVFNSQFLWMNLMTHVFGNTIEKLIEKDNYRSFGISIEKLLYKSLVFMRNNAQQLNLTKEQAKLCQSGLLLIQQIISIPWECYIKTRLIEEMKTLDFKSALDSLQENHNHIIKMEAVNLYITLIGLCNFSYKTLPGLNNLMKLKQRINDEEKGSLVIPTHLYYFLNADDINQQITIRNVEEDFQKLRNQKQFNKYVIAKMNGFSIYLTIYYNRGEIYGNGKDDADNEIKIGGHIRLEQDVIQKQYKHGIELYGTGELILDRKEERYHFDIFITQDLKKQFYIIGESSSDSIIFEFI